MAGKNNLKDPNKIHVGQVLTVDGDAPTTVVSYKDGTYTGTGSQKFDLGTLTANVSVVIKDGKYTSVKVANDPTTGKWAAYTGGGTKFLSAFAGKVVGASVADIVDGATSSAKDVKNAVNAAAAKAKTPTAVEPETPTAPTEPVTPPTPVVGASFGMGEPFRLRSPRMQQLQGWFFTIRYNFSCNRSWKRRSNKRS